MAGNRLLHWADQKVIPFYRIDRKGNISSTFEGDFDIQYKSTCSPKGKTPKFYLYALIRFRGRDRWLAVHRLMCYTWLGSFPHPLRFICDHIDSNSLNNNLWNLRYLTLRGNNLNRKNVVGVVSRHGLWYPRIAGHVHKRYGHPDKAFAQIIRRRMVECYIRYTNRFPATDGYPHGNITSF